MANINELLKGNNYGDIIIPLVNAYNATQKVVPNPHEVNLVASLLHLRTQTFGGNISVTDIEELVNAGVRGARAENAASPKTARVEQLIQELNGLRMSQPNAYIDWITASSEFTRNAFLVDYFNLEYKNGSYGSYYSEAAGLYNHRSKNIKGLIMGIEPSSAEATAGGSQITFESMSEAQAGKYFIVYTTLATAVQIWYNSGVTPAPALAVIPGVTVTLIEAASPVASGTSLMADAMVAAVEPDPAFAQVIKTADNKVAFQTVFTGVRPVSDYDDLDKTWTGQFLQGMNAGEDTTDSINGFSIDFTYADESLADKIFIIKDALNVTTGLWFRLDGAAAGYVCCPGVGGQACIECPDSAIAIDITTGMTPLEIATATKAALDTITYITSTTIVGTTINTVFDAPLLAESLDVGNTVIGVSYKYDPFLVASDGTVLASDIDSGTKYIESWNTLKIPAEALLGNTYPYLVDNILTTGGPGDISAIGIVSCGTCDNVANSREVIAWGLGTGFREFTCITCPSLIDGGTYRTSASNPNGDYNTPGNIFDSTALIAKLTPINQLI